ncbi:MAG: PQQ-binding-like beta-propeller repeat protein [Isosphaeraceae bacterium]
MPSRHRQDAGDGPGRDRTSRGTTRALRSSLTVFSLALAAAIVGQVVAQQPGANRAGSTFYADFSDTADALLRNAANHVREKQWAEAIDIYQRVIQQFGDKVAKLPRDEAAQANLGDSQLYVDLRQFCQQKLASLPPEARAIYRSRMDGQAERWFRQGQSDRDRNALRRVVDQAFCSSWGDDAIELLGDLAFQEGRFDETLACYRRLVPDAPGGSSGLVHPDPSVDLARVAAKKLICRAAQGDVPPTPEDLDAFKKAYPNAAGALAGRDGPYSDTLTAALADDHLAPLAQPDGRWPTFAGSPQRTRIVPGAIDIGSIQWRVDLEPIASNRTSRSGRAVTFQGPPTSPAQRLGYHPIVLGDQVIVCDESRVTAYNLNDRPEVTNGSVAAPVKVAWRHDEEQGNVPQAPRFAVGLPRYTLTAYGDRIYARMGMTAFSPMGGMASGNSSYLVALDKATDGKLLWKRPPMDVMAAFKPAEAAVRRVGFEGTPVADARNVYVAMTERREQTSTYVACLDAETGATRWVRYLGAAASDNENPFGFGMGMGLGNNANGDYGHRLLTLDGPTLYYQTNLGAVASLDAETGSVRWVATYPRVDRAGSTRERDLNPAIVHDGLVIAAPDDSASIYAFDAASGRLVWKTDPIPEEIKLAHLLGVAKGRLVATGDRVLLFDVKTGKLAHTWPDSGQGFESHGRGLLAGDKIYWPTRSEIHVLDQATGLRSDPPIRLQASFQTTGGNLAVGDGYLVVAQADQLVVFCQNRRLIQRYREEIARTPDQAGWYLRLARAAEATDQDEMALDSLRSALAKSRPSEVFDGAPLADLTRDQMFRLLLRMGDKARSGKDLVAAEARYHAAAESARGTRDCLRARLAEAAAQSERGEPKRAVATLQGLLKEERFRSIAILSEEGRRSVRSDLLIADRLNQILATSGRSVYQPYESEAATLLARGRAESDPNLLEAVSISYPVATVVPESLLVLARYHMEHGQPAEAARASKRLLAVATSETLRAKAWLGLARAHEARKLWGPARDAYMELLTRFPGVTLEADDHSAGMPLGSLVTKRLGQAPFDQLTLDQDEPPIALPLQRRWSRVLGTPFKPLLAEGTPPTNELGRVFLSQGGRIEAVSSTDGQTRWAADLGQPAIWIGYRDDRVVAATSDRVVALDLSAGKKLWQFDATPPGAPSQAPDPFARNPAGDSVSPGPPQALSGFRMIGSRLFVLRGGRELLAIDCESGLVDWSFGTGTGNIGQHLFIGPDRVILQSRAPNALVVLDSSTGHRRAEFPEDREQDEWLRDPFPLDDDRVVLVPDRRTVVLFDVNKGVNAWVFRESRELPKNGPPRAFGDPERLLVVHDGSELIRVDVSTGTRLWSRPLGSEDLSERIHALALDAERVYWASGQTLRAAALKDGALVWSKHLAGAESGWSIGLTQRLVAAYPDPTRRSSDEPWGLSLVFRRRETGDLVQRIPFPAPVTDVAVALTSRAAMIASQTNVWGLEERRPVDGPATER